MTIPINVRAYVHCERCRNAIEVTLTEIFYSFGNAWDDRGVADELERFGWTSYGDGYICPGHENNYICPGHENEIADEEESCICKSN